MNRGRPSLLKDKIIKPRYLCIMTSNILDLNFILKDRTAKSIYVYKLFLGLIRNKDIVKFKEFVND